MDFWVTGRFRLVSTKPEISDFGDTLNISHDLSSSISELCEWESEDFLTGVLVCFHVGIDGSLIGSEKIFGVHSFFLWEILECSSSFSGDFFLL